jgi:hypothetical protein
MEIPRLGGKIGCGCEDVDETNIAPPVWEKKCRSLNHPGHFSQLNQGGCIPCTQSINHVAAVVANGIDADE